MLQRNNEIFKELANVFGIADDILVVVYDRHGTDYDETLRRVLKIYRKENFKLNIDKCCYGYKVLLFLGRYYVGVEYRPMYIVHTNRNVFS